MLRCFKKTAAASDLPKPGTAAILYFYLIDLFKSRNLFSVHINILIEYSGRSCPRFSLSADFFIYYKLLGAFAVFCKTDKLILSALEMTIPSRCANLGEWLNRLLFGLLSCLLAYILVRSFTVSDITGILGCVTVCQDKNSRAGICMLT